MTFGMPLGGYGPVSVAAKWSSQAFEWAIGKTGGSDLPMISLALV